MRKRLLTLTITVMAALGLMAAPAAAQPVQQDGLVNVNLQITDFDQLILVQDVLRDIDITVEDVEVRILSPEGDLIRVQEVLTDFEQLVNIEDIQVLAQVPIGVAANVCNVGANVLAQQLRQTGEADCEADAGSALEARQFQNFTNRGGGNR